MDICLFTFEQLQESCRGSKEGEVVRLSLPFSLFLSEPITDPQTPTADYFSSRDGDRSWNFQGN